MDNLAKKHHIYRPQLEYGKVVSTGDPIVVATELGELCAKKAVGCLINPAPGDKVLLSMDDQPSVWVLSVLERLSSSPQLIELEGDAVLRTKSGSLTIAADNELNCISQKTTLHTGEAEVTAMTTSFTAHLFTSNVARVKRVAEYVDDISIEFNQRVKNYFRFTEKHEECQAGSRRQLTEETTTIHSKNTTIVSEENVKIDGKLVHMG